MKITFWRWKNLTKATVRLREEQLYDAVYEIRRMTDRYTNELWEFDEISYHDFANQARPGIIWTEIVAILSRPSPPPPPAPSKGRQRTSQLDDNNHIKGTARTRKYVRLICNLCRILLQKRVFLSLARESLFSLEICAFRVRHKAQWQWQPPGWF